jgi:hypothetical protein
MRLFARKSPREYLVRSLFFLSAEKKLELNRWLRGRHEYGKLSGADCVIVSFPKSGRTWLRTMLTHFYQTRFGIERMELVGFYNFHKHHPDMPRIFFTHDNYIKNYTGHHDDKSDFYGKKVVLLVRDPRDVAVSSYFQRKFRGNPLKDGLRDIEVGEDGPSMFEFVTFRIPNIVAFLNAWARELPKVPDSLVVRYEDLRAEPAENLRRILTFMGTDASLAEAEAAVAFGRYENMKKLEAEGAFGRGDRRINPGDQANPQSFKTRRGKVGGYRDYFTDEEVRQIDALIQGPAIQQFEYAEAEPAQPPDLEAGAGAR